MTRILAVCLFFSTLIWWIVPAVAQEFLSVTQSSRMSVIEPGGPGCFADVLIVDRAGVYNADVALETSLGTVVVRYDTRTNHADPDFAEVMSLPQNVVAQPPSLDLVPSETSVMCLIELQGM